MTAAQVGWPNWEQYLVIGALWFLAALLIATVWCAFRLLITSDEHEWDEPINAHTAFVDELAIRRRRHQPGTVR